MSHLLTILACFALLRYDQPDRQVQHKRRQPQQAAKQLQGSGARLLCVSAVCRCVLLLVTAVCASSVCLTCMLFVRRWLLFSVRLIRARTSSGTLRSLLCVCTPSLTPSLSYSPVVVSVLLHSMRLDSFFDLCLALLLARAVRVNKTAAVSPLHLQLMCCAGSSSALSALISWHLLRLCRLGICEQN